MKLLTTSNSHRKKIVWGAPIVFLLLLGSTGSFSSGNIFNFRAPQGVFVEVGDAVPIYLDVSTKTAVNAVGGTITFTQNILSADSLTRSTSIIDLWSEEPVISNTDGQIHFSGGIVAPDIESDGEHGQIFTVNFRALKSGNALIEMKKGELLAHNGEGTNVLSGSNSLRIFVRDQGRPTPDVNGDGTLSISDINKLYLDTFRAYDAQNDMNGDGKVNWGDVKILIGML